VLCQHQFVNDYRGFQGLGTECKDNDITVFQCKHGGSEPPPGIDDIDACPTELDDMTCPLNLDGNLVHTPSIRGSIR